MHGRDPQGVRVPEASETTSCPGGADRRLPRSLRRLSAAPRGSEAVRGGGKLCAGCGQSAAGGMTRGKEQGRGGGQRATLTSQDLRTRLGMPGLAAAMKPPPPQGSPQVGAGPAARQSRKRGSGVRGLAPVPERRRLPRSGDARRRRPSRSGDSRF